MTVNTKRVASLNTKGALGMYSYREQHNTKGKYTMPEFIIDNAPRPPKDFWRDLSLIERGFVEAMFFTADTDAEGDGEEQYPEDLTQANVNELSDEAIEKIKVVCNVFENHPAYLRFCDWRGEQDSELDDEQIGRDLWYTSQGHGVGFWEGKSRGYPGEWGDVLSKVAKIACHETHLYRGIDGKLYLG